ncbi:phage tail protein [Ilyobacter sp.]|uniref:phage tail protein n=1 Tax=Ilyobacter sp. TaxID=3100343 RepID=UPI0035616CC8
MTKIADLDFTSLLPEHLRQYDNIKSMTKIFENQVKEKILPKIPQLFMYKDFENMDEDLLDELAISWHVDFYDEQLIKSKKAAMVSNSYISHLGKGTEASLQDALDDVFGGIEILKWFQYGVDPFTFKLIVDNSVPTPEEVDRIYEMANHYKGARDHITGFTVSTTDQLNLEYTVGSHSSGRIVSMPAAE